MNDNTKIKYTFHNQHGETVDLTFTILEIEGTVGGFMAKVNETLDGIGFGDVTEVYRMLLIG